MNYTQDIPRENRKIKILCQILALLSIKNILFTVPFILHFNKYINAIVIVYVLMAFLYDFLCDRHCKKTGTVIVIMAFMLFCCFQVFFFPKNQVFFCGTIPNMIIYGVIPFVLIYEINDYEQLYINLKTVGMLIIFAGIIGLYGIISTNIDYSYSMSYGNFVVIGVAIIEYFLLKDRKLVYCILFFIGLIELIVGASRASFLVPVTIFILYQLLINRVRSVKHIFGLILIICSTLLIAFNFETLVNALESVLLSHNVSSRNLFLITSGEFFSSSSRIDIYTVCLKLINDNWITGIGVEGLQGLGYTDLTPHNTYIELLLYNGVIAGILFIIILVILWVHGILYKHDKWLYSLIIIWFSLYVSRSFTGAGILTNINFWILLSLSIKSLKVHSKYRDVMVRKRASL